MSVEITRPIDPRYQAKLGEASVPGWIGLGERLQLGNLEPYRVANQRPKEGEGKVGFVVPFEVEELGKGEIRLVEIESSQEQIDGIPVELIGDYGTEYGVFITLNEVGFPQVPEVWLYHPHRPRFIAEVRTDKTDDPLVKTANVDNIWKDIDDISRKLAIRESDLPLIMFGIQQEWSTDTTTPGKKPQMWQD